MVLARSASPLATRVVAGLVIAGLVIASLTLAEPRSAQAQEGDGNLAKASQLYARGEQAHEDGRHEEAARAFSEADVLVPNEAALQAALVSVLETDEAVLAMNLVARAARAPFDTPLQDLADQARQRFEGGVGRVVIHCDGCQATIDERPVPPGIATYITAGHHEVVLVVEGHRERQAVDVEPRAIVTLVPVGSPTRPSTPGPPALPPPLLPPLPGATDRGPSPVWFWAGLGITAAFGAGAIASAVDTMNRHDAFEDTPTQQAADAGASAQLRTNVLAGVTAGLGLTTAAVGLFVVDWSGGEAAAASAGLRLAGLRLGPGSASATLRW